MILSRTDAVMDSKKLSKSTLRLKWKVPLSGYEIIQGEDTETETDEDRELRDLFRPYGVSDGDAVKRPPPEPRLGWRGPHPPSQSLRSIWRGDPSSFDPNDYYRTYDIALGETRILRDLLNIGESAELALAFANTWGLLARGEGRIVDLVSTSEEMRITITQARQTGLKSVAQLLDHKLWGDTMEVRVDRKPGSNAPEILWYAKNLRSFCWLEICRELHGACEVTVCPGCGQFFTRKGKGLAPQSCSDKCRKRRQRAKRPAVALRVTHSS